MTTRYACEATVGAGTCGSRELILRGDPNGRGAWLVTCGKGHVVVPVPSATYQIGPS